MRVVAGSAGGITLTVPKSITRPTMDKVRGAIFSSLGDAVPGSRVLDLFAGSGAFGIEALSRGAISAVFVDNHRNAIEAIRTNFRHTRVTGNVHMTDVLGFLKTCSEEAAFDLIFADPPYKKHESDADFALQLLSLKNLHELLTPTGTFILETAASQSLPECESLGWTLLRSRTYGDTSVHYLSRLS